MIFRFRNRAQARREGPKRVLILSANVGEGHAAAARAMKEQLEGHHEPVEVTVVDGLREMGRTLKTVVEDGYNVQLKWLPWTYTAIYWLLEHVPPARWYARFLLCAFGSRRLRRTIERHDPDVVLSTYPSITVVMARLRRIGKIKMPTVATITDMTGLFFWAQPGVDLHLVMYGESIAPVERIAGPDSVRLVAPLISGAFLEPRRREDARRVLDLPPEAPVLVVSGGGWGVGDIEGAVRELADHDPSASIVCLAGRNDSAERKLVEAFADRPNVRVLGFTDQMPELLAAADVLVHSTGGVTCLEAMACGCPVVSYGLPVGHARINTRAMADLGLVRLADDRSQLIALVDEARLERAEAEAETRHPAPAVETAGELVLDVPDRVSVLAPWRPPLAQAAVAFACFASATTWVLSTDDTASLASRVLKMRPVSAVVTKAAQTPFIVETAPAQAPRVARWLASRGQHASFALDGAPTATTLAALSATQDEVIPSMPRVGGLKWLGSRAPLRRQAVALGLGRTFYFLQPARGLTVGELVQARRAGGRPVVGAYGPLRAGSIVVVTVDSSSASMRALDEVISRVSDAGLAAVPLSTLAPSPATNARRAGERSSTTAPATSTIIAATSPSPAARLAGRSLNSSGASATGTTV